MKSFLPAISVAAFIALFAQARPIGLVLSGGGARGAYEVGVWRAVCELGLKDEIAAISGSSVGALNAALFAAVSDPELCEAAWIRTVSTAFSVNTNKIHKIVQGNVNAFDEILDDQTKGKDVAEGKDFVCAGLILALKAFIDTGDAITASMGGEDGSEGLLDSGCLRDSLGEILPDGPFPSHPAAYVTVVNKGKGGSRTFSLSGLDKSVAIEKLMASAALPGAFDSVSIDGEQYVDGGFEMHGGDNVPIWPIVENHKEIRTIVVVYLKEKNGVPRKVRREDFRGVEIIEIFPSRDIGSIFSLIDSSEAKSRELISLGRNDALKALNKLKWFH